MELLFSVQNQVISRTDSNIVVAKSKNYLTAKFTFSSDWDTATTKTAVFFNEALNLSVNVALDSNNECDVPSTVIYDPNFLVSVFGYAVSGVDLTTVNNYRVCVAKSGYPDPAPIPVPTQDYVKTINEETGTNKVMYIREKNNELQYSIDGETWLIGVVILGGADIDSANTPTNYTVATADVDAHLAGIDTALGNRLAKDNATEYTPTGDYNPATKKYIDDSIPTDISELTDTTGIISGKQALNLVFSNTAVLTTDFVADTTYVGYGFRASITLTGVLATDIASVAFAPVEADSGNYASVVNSYAGGIYIYAKSVPSATITIPTILVVKGA